MIARPFFQKCHGRRRSTCTSAHDRLVHGDEQGELLRAQGELTTSRKDARLGLSARGAWPVLCALSSSKRAPRCCSLLEAEGAASAVAAAFGCWSAAPGHHSFSPPSLQPTLSMACCIPCAPGADERHTPPLLTALSIWQRLCCLSGLACWSARCKSPTSDEALPSPVLQR